MSKITGGGYLPEWSGLMKIMAIDLGDARTGVAVSDTLGMLTGQTSVIESWNKEKTAQLVAEAYRKSGAERLVMGFPRNMDGSEGPRADLYRAFAAKLEELINQPVVLWDERRTTIEAHQILSDNNCHGKKRKKTDAESTFRTSPSRSNSVIQFDCAVFDTVSKRKNRTRSSAANCTRQGNECSCQASPRHIVLSA